AGEGQAPAGAQGGRQRNQATADGEQPGGGAGRSANRSSDTAGVPQDRAVVWKLTPDKQLVPVQIKTGITDHTVTEVAQVLKGSLNDGDQLITGSSKTSATAYRAPRPPGVGGG